MKSKEKQAIKFVGKTSYMKIKKVPEKGTFKIIKSKTTQLIFWE